MLGGEELEIVRGVGCSGNVKEVGRAVKIAITGVQEEK